MTRFFLAVWLGLVAMSLPFDARAADEVVVDMSGGVPDKPAPLGSAFTISVPAGANVKAVYGVFIQYAFSAWQGHGDFPNGCQEVESQLAMDPEAFEQFRPGLQTTQKLFTQEGKGPALKSLRPELARRPALALSAWVRTEQPADAQNATAARLKVPASSFFQSGARYCFVAFEQVETERSLLPQVKQLSKQITACGDDASCKNGVLKDIAKILGGKPTDKEILNSIQAAANPLVNMATTKTQALGFIDKAKPIVKLGAFEPPLDRAGARWFPFEPGENRPAKDPPDVAKKEDSKKAAPKEDPKKDSAKPGLATAPSTASSESKLLARRVNMALRDKGFSADATGLFTPGSEKELVLGFRLSNGKLHLLISKKSSDGRKLETDVPFDSVPLGDLPLVENKAFTLADLDALGSNALWTGSSRLPLSDLRHAVEVTEADTYDASFPTFQAAKSAIDRLAEVRSDALLADVVDDESIRLISAAAGQMSARKNDSWNPAAAKAFMQQAKVVVSVEVTVGLTRDTWFANYVVPTVGYAVTSVDAKVPTVALQIYFFPNVTNEPMWTNGVDDFRRFLSIEAGIGADLNQFGPEDRWSGIKDAPPILLGAGLNFIPWTTVSTGVMLAERRRSTLTQENATVKPLWYVNFSVQANVPDIIKLIVKPNNASQE